MKGWFAGLLGFTFVVAMLAIAYVTQATWEGRARDTIPVFDAAGDVMYEGPAGQAPQPRFGIRNGDPVWVLWDFRERGYWVCYLVLPDGRRGWGSCKPVQRDEARP